MKKTALLFALAASVAAHAQTFTDSTTVQFQTAGGPAQVVFKMMPPQGGAAPWQGVMLFAVQNTGKSASEDFLANPQMQAFATQARVALVLVKSRAAGNTGLAGFSPLNGTDTQLATALQNLATSSSHPEVAHAPILAAGFGPCADFAIGLGYWNPSRIAAIVTVRPLGITAPAWASQAPYDANNLKQIPHLVLTGEVSGPDVNGNQANYLATALKTAVLARRSQNELVHLAVEANASQNTLKEKTAGLLSAFMMKAASARIPANSNATTGPIALNALTENSGFLSQATAWNSFRPGNYQSATFGGSLPAAQSNWLFDQAYAQTWTDFHVNPYDSAVFYPASFQFIPYCSGTRPSPLGARWQMRSGITFDTNNVFRIEVSDVTGNFDNDRFPARAFGSVKSQFLNDSIADVLLPDNFQFMNQAPNQFSTAINVPIRYRMRIVSTHPYTESYNSGEVPYWRLCPITAPVLYMSTLQPMKDRYTYGETATAMLYKTATANIPAGSFIRLVLSDASGNFKNVPTTHIDSIPAAFTGDSMAVSFRMPTVAPSLRYRMRAEVHGSAFIGSMSNGHDVVLGPSLVGILPRYNRDAHWMIAAPNPTSGSARLQWSAPLKGDGILTVLDMNGRELARYPIQKNSTLFHLTRPAYQGTVLLRLTDGKASYVQTLVCE